MRQPEYMKRIPNLGDTTLVGEQTRPDLIKEVRSSKLGTCIWCTPHTVTIIHPRFIGLVKDLIRCGPFCKQHNITLKTF